MLYPIGAVATQSVSLVRAQQAQQKEASETTVEPAKKVQIPNIPVAPPLPMNDGARQLQASLVSSPAKPLAEQLQDEIKIRAITRQLVKETLSLFDGAVKEKVSQKRLEKILDHLSERTGVAKEVVREGFKLFQKASGKPSNQEGSGNDNEANIDDYSMALNMMNRCIRASVRGGKDAISRKQGRTQMVAGGHSVQLAKQAGITA